VVEDDNGEEKAVSGGERERERERGRGRAENEIC